MKILLLVHGFNSLSQRLFVELRAAGHRVSVEFDIHDDVTRDAVARAAPDLILASFLKRAIPKDIWQHHLCLVVHPGIRGDRGPSALDWAILRGEKDWGVTVVQAVAAMDAGPVWAWRRFAMRAATKSSLYRNEVTDAAAAAVLEAVAKIGDPAFRPQPADATDPDVRGCWNPVLKQTARAIDWQADDTATVLRKIRSADGLPGLRDSLFDVPCYLFDARRAPDLRGPAGSILAWRDGAVCRATTDGAVWIGHVRLAGAKQLKLPAADIFKGYLKKIKQHTDNTYKRIEYTESGTVGFLSFDFLNGAMGTAECAALRVAYGLAVGRPTRVLVLMGGRDYWANGIHLGRIEAAAGSADESWANINAIDDLARDIIDTDSHHVVAVLRGNAGAGGVFLALAADEVWARRGVVLNPHYKDIGNLYGSEYWTYLLPRRCGADNAAAVVAARLPMGALEARDLGLIDRLFDLPMIAMDGAVQTAAQVRAADPGLAARLEAKRDRRRRDEAEKPLAAYRDDELTRMKLNFYGFDSSYHVARYNFIHKVAKSRTPLHLATHRSLSRARK